MVIANLLRVYIVRCFMFTYHLLLALSLGISGAVLLLPLYLLHDMEPLQLYLYLYLYLHNSMLHSKEKKTSFCRGYRKWLETNHRAPAECVNNYVTFLYPAPLKRTPFLLHFIACQFRNNRLYYPWGTEMVKTSVDSLVIANWETREVMVRWNKSLKVIMTQTDICWQQICKPKGIKRPANHSLAKH